VITSPNNRKVSQAVSLKKRAFRERNRRFLVEGAGSVEEAIGNAGRLETLFHSDPADGLVERARAAGASVLRVSEGVMGRLASTVTPPGLVGVAAFLDVPLASLAVARGCVVVLHAVRDPGNAGAVLRSTDAAGGDAVVFGGTSVDVYNPKTVRASAGSMFHVPIVRGVETVPALEQLRERGMRVLATDPEGDEDLFQLDLSTPSAFLFGNEAWGLPKEVAAAADATVRVPIAGGAESLNVAAAATAFLFEWARQRREVRRTALETLIAAAAHDIRSPLTAMKGFGFALQRRWEQMTEEHRSTMLAGILHDTDRMDTIVKQLVDAARVVSGRFEAFPEEVEVKALVEDLGQMLSRDPEHPGVVWEGPDARAFVDRDRLRTTVHAFVESAVWWAREGPVHASASARRERLRVQVWRGGTELESGSVEWLFEPRRPGTGAGSKIGLYVARGVAEAQGGFATAEVRDGALRLALDLPFAKRP